MAKIQHPGTKDDIIKSSGRQDPVTKKGYIAIDDEALIDAINGITNGATDTQTEILNETLVANTELEIDCGAQVKYILIRSRNGKRLKLAYGLTLTASEYITIERGAVYSDDAFYSTLKIYLLCEAADTVEVLIKRNV